jgi:hypothetical protein
MGGHLPEVYETPGPGPAISSHEAQATRSPADVKSVSQIQTITAADLDDVLWQLPETFALAQQGPCRLVVGPAGCTVVAAEAGVPDVHHDVEALAQGTRTALADHLEWVPFVDALVVTTGTTVDSVGSCELGSLRALLADGPDLLDATAVSRITALLNERRLEPSWDVVRSLSTGSGTLY